MNTAMYGGMSMRHELESDEKNERYENVRLMKRCTTKTQKILRIWCDMSKVKDKKSCWR